jgi:hypothetical protein
MGSILPCRLPFGKAGGLQILRCQWIAVANCSFTIDALTLKPSDFCNVGVRLSDRIFQIFLEERDAENPNLPLIRKYFKSANQNLKTLILYCLDHYPGSFDLLADLDYFHEFENILSTLIAYYTRACVDQENLETFSELARDFYFATKPDGYEALNALRDLFEAGTDKRKVVDFLIANEEDAGKGSNIFT